MINPEENNKINQKKRFTLSFIGNLIYFFGIMTPFGIGQYSVYITSYFHHFNQKINIQMGNLMMPILTLALSLSAPLGGFLEHKFGMHLSLIINGIILEFLIFIFISQKNIWITFILIILIGMSIGSVISIPGKNLCFYYPEKRGTIISLITSFNVIIGALVSVLGEKLINPEKITLKENETYYPLEVAKNYIKFYKLSLIVIPISSFLSLPFLKKYKETHDKQNEKLDKNIINNKSLEKANYSKNLKAAICHNRIWKIAFITIFSQFGIGFGLSTFRVYGALMSFNGTLMQYAPLFFGLSMIVFGPIWGYINDRLQNFKIVKIICIFLLFNSIILSLFIKSKFIYISCLFIGSVFTTGINTVMRPFIMKIYGMKYFIEIGGVITICSGIANIFKGLLSFVISFYYHTGNELQIPYRIIFIIGIWSNILAYALASKEKGNEFYYPDDQNKVSAEDLSIEMKTKEDINTLEKNDVAIKKNLNM